MMLLLWGAQVSFAGWEKAPDPIDRMLQTPPTPGLSFSPDRQWMMETQRSSSPSIADLARPELKLAGMKIDADRALPSRTFGYLGMTLKSMDGSQTIELSLPAGTKIYRSLWSPDSQQLALELLEDEGLSLWLLSLGESEPARLTPPILHASISDPCSWLTDPSEGLVCLVRHEQAPLELPPLGMDGPRIESNDGRKRPARTYTNLLKNQRDEALFEHYLLNQVVQITPSGEQLQLTEPGWHIDASPSPDGSWLLLESMEPPWSRQVPWYRFPMRTQALERSSGELHEIAFLPLAEEIPIAHGAARQGYRRIGWRTDQPASLWLAEALDGGDPRTEAEHRDRLLVWEAPFEAEPQEIWRGAYRFSGVQWGSEEVALVSESWWATRDSRQWRIRPGDLEEAPQLLVERNLQDAYADPGSALTRRNDWGRRVLSLGPDGKQILRSGQGASPEGVYPFLDQQDLDTLETKRLWQASGREYETLVAVLDDQGERFITRRESKQDPPNYFLHEGRRRARALTSFKDPAPELSDLQKELIRYQRSDGVELSATVYTPPGWKKRDGPLPTLFWAYPREHKDPKTAGQVTVSEYRFTRPRASSVLFLLTQGYALVMGPGMPIIGKEEAEPNDSYVEQLVSSAEAAVQAAVDLGVADPERVAIGGHSYGAFTTANLLAHSDIFQAGVARSGAYNRSLTPFGFQAEQRDYWEAMDTYLEMSPFTHADEIDEPMLMIHGAADPNSGTYPMQSARMYEALRGLGATVRWVELPYEEHGYRSYEALSHTHWETVRWLDRHLKGLSEEE